MIAGATMLTVKTSGEPCDKSGLIDLKLDHVVDPETTLRQHLIQGLGLRQRARKAVENKAVSAIRLADTIGDHVDDDSVGNQLTGIHDALDTEPELATG